MDQGESSLVLADSCQFLTLEGGVHESELPARRWLPRQDSVLPPDKTDVFGFVPAIVNAGQSGPDPELHVGEIAVLCVSCPHADRTAIALSDLQIDVAHRRVKRPRRGVPRHAEVEVAAAAS